MSHQSEVGSETLLGSRVALPDHVVYREFPAETVVLNLQTETYFGLNPTAGAMLVSLASTGDVRVTAAEMAERFDRSADQIEQDLLGLCRQLMERGLITATPVGHSH